MTDYVFGGFYFSLTFLGDVSQMDAAFQEVSGLSKEMDLEEVTCGGENRFKYRLPTIPKHQNLVLKRGITTDISQLRNWCLDTLDSGLTKPIKTQDLQLLLLDENGVTCMSWLIHKAYPVKWHMSELNSEKNAIAIETLELCYRIFEVEVEDDMGLSTHFA
jgi:phage tail-like protein